MIRLWAIFTILWWTIMFGMSFINPGLALLFVLFGGVIYLIIGLIVLESLFKSK